MTSPELAAFSSIYDETYYLGQNIDVKAAVDGGVYSSGWEHFSLHGLSERRSPSGGFDAAYYLTKNADFLEASSQRDLILGIPGGDVILGLGANDYINGNQENDYIYGNQGDDILHGGTGNDTLQAGQDNDQVYGDLGHDLSYGELGDDTVIGNEGSDSLFGDAGNDYLNGNVEADNLLGGEGNDTLQGGQGEDSLNGDAGDDSLSGDLGNDTIAGNLGADTIAGGLGSDVFVIGQGTGGPAVANADFITDFVNNEDLIKLIEPLTFEDLNIVQNTVENLPNILIEDKLTGEYLAVLKGIDADQISPNDFIFTPKPLPEVFPPGYYVSPAGSDENSGTPEEPFQTIQKAATVAQAGDTVYIRAGTYREKITPANSGTADQPITFKPYKDEEVIVSGADLVTNWNLHEGNIYKAPMNGDLGEGNNQIFVNGQMMVEARWPNIDKNPAEVTRLDNAVSDTGTVNNPNASRDAIITGTYTDSDLTQPANFWNDAKINFVPGLNWHPQTGDVTSSAPGTINFDFKWGAAEFYKPQESNYFYLWGSYSALDTAKEWFYDPNSTTLYLWAPNSGDPAVSTVEAKARITAFELRDKSHITVEGIDIFGANINTNQSSSHILLDKIDVKYGSHSQVIPGLYLVGTPSIKLAGNYHEIRNSHIAYSYDSGVRIDKNSIGTKISNSVIHDTAYAGLDAAPIVAAGTQTQIVNNTLFNNGATPLINLRDLDNVSVMYNEAYNGGLQLSDNGGILAFKTDGKGSQIAYNAVHDIKSLLNYDLSYYGGPGIYLDESYNFNVHHNVVWEASSEGLALRPRSSGINDPAIFNNIYNNTFDDSIWFQPTGNTFAGTVLKNNVYSELSRTKPRADIIFENNIVAAETDPKYIAPAARDYQLQGTSSAIDAGQILAPFTDGFAGAAPDIGAFESGQPAFIPGAVILEENIPALKLTFNEPIDGKVSGQITGLPIGRKLPGNFKLKIGTSEASGNFFSSYIDPVTHLSTVVFTDVEIGSQRGSQLAFAQIGTGTPISTRQKLTIPAVSTSVDNP
ncbi:right-handed parallel beta-helix repeat-containing protein [Microcoleus sp. FACHB-672]|uniref:right-handed parallel beta-helix repeat-containing protein n=1 Tax=Microcoleus sp. FACHB-672 TaxID=2692825 RepID=UPI0016861DB9|nr:right-handed parallel beta-helix repeat-containing protein [Microcoleus sp. FACHB-672]MBD2043464.1 right-handed parallel beta-helix repeat-containing protein [Microcoleus sp. FACHB-672]